MTTPHKLFVITPAMEEKFHIGQRMVPAQGWDVDQWKYTPLDGGWLLLSGIGVAYLLRKRRKE